MTDDGLSGLTNLSRLDGKLRQTNQYPVTTQNNNGWQPSLAICRLGVIVMLK